MPGKPGILNAGIASDARVGRDRRVPITNRWTD
jgi:hypothetical protein